MKPPPYWIWPIRLPRLMAQQAFTASFALGQWLRPWYRGLAAGVLAGALPLLLDCVTGWASCRLVTALLLTLLLLAAVARDSLTQGILLVGSAFCVHGGLVVALAAHYPAWMAEV